MKICAVADLHGHLPETPECDLLLLAGDCAPSRQMRDFPEWLAAQPAQEIVGIAGNHDFWLQENVDEARSWPWTYLQDESIVVGGLVIHGAPWTPEFCGWAFMREDSDLREKWDLIPDDVDILLTHGPPWGVLDLAQGVNHAGSKTLASRIEQLWRHRDSPITNVFGHIHEGFGRVIYPSVSFYNVSYVNERYQPVNGFTEFEV